MVSSGFDSQVPRSLGLASIHNLLWLLVCMRVIHNKTQDGEEFRMRLKVKEQLSR